jgi:hypothetical protein
VGLLKNNALIKHPYLKHRPPDARAWEKFVQAFNAQEVEYLVIDEDGFVRSGQTAYDTGTGFWIGNDGGTPRVSIGNSAGNKVTWDGTTLTIAGNVVLGSGNFLRSGQTAYNTGTGFWIGNDSGTPRFSIGNSAGARLTWDGTTLSIFDADGADATIDNLVFKGDSNTNPSIGQLIGSAVETFNAGGTDEWQPLRTIVTNFTGTFRLRVEALEVVTGVDAADGAWRLKNGAGNVVHTETISSPTYVDTFSGEETVTEAGETWTIEGRSQTDLSTYTIETRIRDIEVRTRMDHATIT